MKWFRALKKSFPDARVWLVGGAVRDALLHRPTKDDDYVVGGVGAKDLERFLARQGKVNLVGRTFGVFKFRPRSGVRGRMSDVEYDIALPRTDHPKGTGGYKDVETQSDPSLPIEKDLARRDFTVNAMATDLATKKLVDPFGGKRDLKKKLLRAVGDPRKRFAEDYTRVLRGLRFAAQFGFAFEKKTWNALKKFAPRVSSKRGGRPIVPTEVAVREFRKAFAANPLAALLLWRDAGVLKPRLAELGPRLAAGKVMRNPPSAARLIDVEQRLKDAAAGEAMAVAAFLGASPARIAAWTRELKKLRVKPLLSGNEVMKALGLSKPSPKIGEVLRALRKAQFDGTVHRHGDALAFVRKTVK